MGKGGPESRAGGQIVGIIGDVKNDGLDEADVSRDLSAVPSMAGLADERGDSKTTTPPETMAEAARREVYAVDPNLPLSSVRTLDQIVATSISQPRFYMLLLAIFAASPWRSPQSASSASCRTRSPSGRGRSGSGWRSERREVPSCASSCVRP